MTSRHSPSRQSSFSYSGTTSRRSSLRSNPDVFSDDYALEPIDPQLELSLDDSEPIDLVSDGFDRNRDTSQITPYPAIPPRLSMTSRPNSTAKRPPLNDNASQSGATERTLSTSSRFSNFRSQSPYSGPTQPSHPYALYPQVTRASSVASGSTIQPQERPFVPTGGPAHPYALYTQNTVPEDSDDDDDDIGSQPIPLGFPRIGLGYQRTRGGPNSDVGDIIGSDGHIEQLPPYTRYADNVVAKGDMADINRASAAGPSRRTSQRSTLVPVESSSSTTTRMEVQEPGESEILLDQEKRRDSWKEKAQKRVCGGIALWLLICIAILIIFAGVIGGVIGGVVGRRQGTTRALQSGAATTTVWLDADPASTDRNTPACPTGHFSIPFNQTDEINACVVDDDVKATWSCLDIAFLGINIQEEPLPTGNKSLTVRFDDYSVDTSKFLYGPQPPDFNGSTFELKPFNDRDNQKLGVAMFFAQLFDKLLIIPGPALPLPNSKRSISELDVLKRSQVWDGTPLAIADKPWFCFWNETINEFWIFLDDSVNMSSPATSMSTITSSPYAASTAAVPDSSKYDYSTPTSVSAMRDSESTQWQNIGFPPSPTASYAKRGSYTSLQATPYPKLVKMVEKRKPSGNVPPYCQRMQVLNDWQIVPTEDYEMVLIEESDYADNPTSISTNQKRSRGLVSRDNTHDLESNCVCEWMSE